MSLDLERRNKLIAFAAISLPSLIIALMMIMMLFKYFLRPAQINTDIMWDINWVTFTIALFFASGALFGFWMLLILDLIFILFLFFIMQIILQSPLKVFLVTLPALIPVGYLLYVGIYFENFGIIIIHSVLWGLTIGLPPVVILLLTTFIWKSENSLLRISGIPLLLISLLPFITIITWLYSI